MSKNKVVHTYVENIQKSFGVFHFIPNSHFPIMDFSSSSSECGGVTL